MPHRNALKTGQKGNKFGNFGDPSLSTGAIAKIKRSPFIYLKADKKCKAYLSLEKG